LRWWLVGNLRSDGNEATETKQANHQPLTAICDFSGFYCFSINSYNI